MEAMISIHAPREGGDADIVSAIHDVQVISIHAPREGGDHRRHLSHSPTGISIHAPREGGDGLLGQFFQQIVISIHAPREGGDRGQTGLSVWGRNFNPRPPRGGRRLFKASVNKPPF